MKRLKIQLSYSSQRPPVQRVLNNGCSLKTSCLLSDEKKSGKNINACFQLTALLVVRLSEITKEQSHIQFLFSSLHFRKANIPVYDTHNLKFSNILTFLIYTHILYNIFTFVYGVSL